MKKTVLENLHKNVVPLFGLCEVCKEFALGPTILWYMYTDLGLYQ